MVVMGRMVQVVVVVIWRSVAAVERRCVLLHVGIVARIEFGSVEIGERQRVNNVVLRLGCMRRLVEIGR